MTHGINICIDQTKHKTGSFCHLRLQPQAVSAAEKQYNGLSRTMLQWIANEHSVRENNLQILQLGNS